MINVNLLPKTLRRRKTLDPWKAASALLPLLVVGVCGALQVQASGQLGRFEAQNRDFQNERAVLQPFVAELRALETERAELASIQEVATAVRSGRVLWSRQLFAMLETRPPPGPQLESRMAFSALEMRALDAATQAQLLSDNTYEGLEAVAEMSVSGVAGSPEVVADYIRELQAAPNFAVVLSDLARDEVTRFYTFNLTIGAARLGRAQAGSARNADAARVETTAGTSAGTNEGGSLP